MIVLGFSEYQQQGKNLAKQLGCEYQEIELHRFPDGESKITLPPTLPKTVILCRSLNHPNDKLVELMLISYTARQQGVSKLILVAPYLCYMRQDIAFHPGEVVSQKALGQFLSEQFDQVITVDPHLHRIDHLSEAIPNITATSLSATPLFIHFMQQLNKPLLIGPDSESEQWIASIAKQANLEYAIAEKVRHGDSEVRITIPERDYKQREIIIVDDVISTGHTIATATLQLKQHGASNIHCLTTHALFSAGAEELLKRAGVEKIWSSDSISHHSNQIELAPLLAEAVEQ